MKHQEFLDLSELIQKPGWKVYQTLLHTEFDKGYKKLRTVTRETLTEHQRYLDGIEKAMKIAQIEVDSYTPDESGQAEQGPAQGE